MYHIPCPHQRKKNFVSYEVTLDDYHPLTKGQLWKLLRVAQRDALTRADIRWRLDQAVPGYTCPRPLEGVVAERLRQLGKVFYEICEGGVNASPVPLTEALVERCFSSMIDGESEPEYQEVRHHGMRDGAHDANEEINALAEMLQEKSVAETLVNIPRIKEQASALCSYTRYFPMEAYGKAYLEAYLAVVKARCGLKARW